MNLLEIMAFMAKNNLDISRADTFVEGKSVKQGANITMGASMKDLINIQTEKAAPVIFLLNVEQYKLLSSGVTDLETLKSKSMSHQEKQEIFDQYAEKKGYESFFEIIHDYVYLNNPNEILNHVLTVCDLVQEEQQKRIAEKAKMKFHDGHKKEDSLITYFQDGANNIQIDKSSIINPENLIK